MPGIQGHEFRATQGSGEPQQKQGAIAQPLNRGAPERTGGGRRNHYGDWDSSRYLLPESPRTYTCIRRLGRGRLIYCGLSGREFEKAVAAGRVRFGLTTRLASHASGRLSGDQFYVYVANRLVIPGLTPEHLATFASGELTLDSLTRDFIKSHLEYQFAIVKSSASAYALEKNCRMGTTFGTEPLLNPV
jgi:hypothetical protein